jgi:heme-degrading monooxygenase HmoA
MFCYVWEFVVRPDEARTFERSYGSEGEWAELFRRDPGYLRTELLLDREAPTRFVTIDFWTSREAWLSFRERFRSEFDALDRRFEALTLRETHLGDFELVG